MEAYEKFAKDVTKITKIGLIMLCIANPLLGLIAGILLNKYTLSEEFRNAGKLGIILSLILIIIIPIVFFIFLKILRLN